MLEREGKWGTGCMVQGCGLRRVMRERFSKREHLSLDLNEGRTPSLWHLGDGTVFFAQGPASAGALGQVVLRS